MTYHDQVATLKDSEYLMKRAATRTQTQSRSPAPGGVASHSRLTAPIATRPSEAIPPVGARKRNFLVRPARRNDLTAVTDLDKRLTGLAKSSHWLEIYKRQKKPGQAPGIFLVAIDAEAAGRLLGFIVGEIRAWEFGSAPSGWVYALSVEPDSRLLGIGEALLESISGEFRKAGIGKMRTMVARDNLLPMLFFRGEGMMAGPYTQLEKDIG
jgi:ribosomal protein S18 acetylase RimI-like enzyme